MTIWADAERDGPPTGAQLLAAAPGEGSVAYLCGPQPMLAVVRAAFEPAIADRRIEALHVERFVPPPIVGGRPFLIELAWATGCAARCRPTGRCSRCCAGTDQAWLTRASRVSAVPAGRGCSPVRSSTGIGYSPHRSGRTR